MTDIRRQALGAVKKGHQARQSCGTGIFLGGRGVRVRAYCVQRGQLAGPQWELHAEGTGSATCYLLGGGHGTGTPTPSPASCPLMAQPPGQPWATAGPKAGQRDVCANWAALEEA